jgi:hypothetical protein
VKEYRIEEYGPDRELRDGGLDPSAFVFQSLEIEELADCEPRCAA